ncbi:MAG TPA: SDR family oxidoreductase [Chloroflexota bacterium]|nr:SDR family oxidoreductase [Chloroflexota bacterium]
MGDWALILGASSGFGGATSVALAKAGWDIFGVHLDRRQTMHNVERIQAEIEQAGRQSHFFNINVADAEKRAAALDEMASLAGDRHVQLLMHSVAFGALKPVIADDPKDALTQAQIEMTLDVMASSLVYWTQELVARKLMIGGGRIYAMTSSGGTRAIPSYGAVSAAKACLEAYIRQLAVELGPRGITANAIRAGVTDTPAARLIPGSDQLFAEALQHNPRQRLTTPGDVAALIALLSRPESDWLSGNVIGVDGGEDVTGGSLVSAAAH